MEKFSAYRDPGTGIQPFLTPVPAHPTPTYIQAWLPFGALFAVVRMTILVLLAAVYALLVDGVLRIFSLLPPLYRTLRWLFTAFLVRVALSTMGFWWIDVETVSKKRSRGTQAKESWKPKGGDVIVSNWASWAELLWLAFRFDPIFVLPVAPNPSNTPTLAPTTGRHTGTGSAALKTLSVPPTPLAGFHTVPLPRLLVFTGYTPASYDIPTTGARTLEQIRKEAKASGKAVVVFPECTTSNGRGLLRFAKGVFGGESVPVKGYGVWIMCVRYDPPTHTSPSPTLSIPSLWAHIFTLGSSLAPLRSMSIRLLAPSESPSSGAFLASDVLPAAGGGNGNVTLEEACAMLIASLGRMKRTGYGWEEKESFLEFYEGKELKRA